MMVDIINGAILCGFIGCSISVVIGAVVALVVKGRLKDVDFINDEDNERA